MTYLAIDERIADALKQLAQVRSVSTQQLTEEALRTYLRIDRQRAIEQESKAFAALHPWLLASYAGQYVAMFVADVKVRGIRAAAISAASTPIIGRDVLNQLNVLLNGPAGVVEVFG